MNFKSVFYNKCDFNLTQRKPGEGAFGAVYITERISDKKEFAVKILKTDKGFDGSQQMLFMRESTILHKLHHPAIVQFYGINLESLINDGMLQPSVITEYLSNGSLRTILYRKKTKTLTPTNKYIILLGIANAMKYLHNNNVIHRDLKPDNILLDENFYPRICDFGLSRCLPETYSESRYLTLTGQIGTILYMAPELIESESYNEGVDVYAFAIFANEIISGLKPYPDLGFFKISKLVIAGGRPEFGDNVTEKMKELLNKCWSSNINERLSFAEIYDKLSKDFSYFNEELDEVEIKKYIELLEKAEIDLNKNNAQNQSSNSSNINNNENSSNINNNENSSNINNNENSSNINNNENSSNINNNKNSSNINNNENSTINNNNPVTEKELVIDLDHNEDYDIRSKEISDEKFYSALNSLLGNPKERNITKAIISLQASSRNSNSQASYLLGLMYENGNGVEQDFKKAIYYYRLSATQGNSYGMQRLGMCFSNGYGVKPNQEIALDYYRKASYKGNIRALCNIGNCYRDGKGVPIDYTKALEHYQLSESKGYAGALCNIGHCYAYGSGVEKDYKKAMEFYQKAADEGDSNALFNIAMLWANGRGVNQDDSKAIQLLNQAANLGNSDAFLNLGIMNLDGRGTDKNQSKAFSFYQKSADLGNSQAFYHLGRCYEYGIGVGSNLQKAFECYQKSVELGNTGACSKLAECYDKGIGVKKDKSMAKFYIDQCTDKADNDSDQKLVKLNK